MMVDLAERSIRIYAESAKVRGYSGGTEQLDTLSFKIDKHKEIATTLEVIANGN